jgi:hypothetical protein
VESVHAVCGRRDYCTFAVVVASRPADCGHASNALRPFSASEPAPQESLRKAEADIWKRSSLRRRHRSAYAEVSELT